MSFEFTHPKFLAGLLLLAGLFWGYRYTLTDFSATQRRLSLFVRSVILILIVLSLAGLTLLSPSTEKMFVFLLDRSRSIDGNAADVAQKYLAEVRTDAEKSGMPLLVVPFATTPSAAPLTTPSSTPALTATLTEETTETELAWQGATNISAALEPALAMIPPNFAPHLVLLSDGNETVGDVLTAAIQSGVPVSTVPLPMSEVPEVQVAEIRMPDQVRQGEPFYLEIVVQSNHDSEAVITLYRGAFKVVEERKPLVKGENVFRFRQSVDDQRQQEFSAAVTTTDTAADTILDNNRASGLLFAGGKPRILLIDSEPRTSRDLAAALREQDIVAEVRPVEGMPHTLDELDHFEAILLSNVPATALSMHQMDLVRTFVSDLGGGFLMLGGEQSFGLGGYYKTPIEEILPVRSDFEKEKEKPSFAICLVIDRSGSMGGQKIELAKDAAKAAVELLSPRDFAAVVAFDHQSYVVSPMQSAASTGTINSAISTIESAGGTNIYPGLVDAHDQLRRISAKLKHVILLTDGFSAPGDYEGIVRQMVGDQITVSTVGVGDADNELLRSIAENGKGRHYSCDDPQAIPQIFAKETMTASKSAVNEMPFVPVVITPTEALAEVDIETAPPLLGFVVTRPKPTSQFILATETSEPLLIWWRYGLGVSVAFTSDAKSRWGAEWLTWPGYSKFWAQVIRQAMRQSIQGAGQRGASVEMTQHPGGVLLTLDVVDEADRYVNEAAGKTTVIRPDLSKEEIVLQPTAPGRYEAEVPLDNRGGYQLQSTLQLDRQTDKKTVLSQSRGVMVGYPDELRLRPTNVELLERLAETTGGLYNPKPAELLNFNSNRVVYRATPLRTGVLTAAALLFVLDVLLRRIDIGRKNKSRERDATP